MIDVEAEVGKHKNCKDRNEFAKLIKGYKELALQYASDIVVAGQYSMVAHKLQEMCDRLPPPNLKNVVLGNSNTPTKTAKISREEKDKINSAWNKKAGRKR